MKEFNQLIERYLDFIMRDKIAEYEDVLEEFVKRQDTDDDLFGRLYGQVEELTAELGEARNRISLLEKEYDTQMAACTADAWNKIEENRALVERNEILEAVVKDYKVLVECMDKRIYRLEADAVKERDRDR